MSVLNRRTMRRRVARRPDGRLSPRALGWGIAGLVLVAATAGAWRWSRARDARTPVDGAAGASASAPMGDMPGMNHGAGVSMSTDGSVNLTTNQLQQFGVTFGPVEVRALSEGLRASGLVAVDERRTTTAAPRYSGFVENVYAVTTGQRVARGQSLAEIYAPEILAAQEELLLATRLARAEAPNMGAGQTSSAANLAAAAKRRVILMGVSEDDVNAIIRDDRARRTVTLRAPASGVIVARRVSVGQAVSAGEPLFELADLGVVWIDADIREGDAAGIREGMTAIAEINALPGQKRRGQVTLIAPMLDAASRALRIRVSLPNYDGAVKPGMLATVRLESASQSSLSVPASAIVRTGDRTLVFVDMGASAGGQSLMPHIVELGRRAGDYVEVLSGVESGQRVVTSAQYLLESESNLAEVMRAMMSQMGQMSSDRPQATPDMNGMSGMEGMKPVVKPPAKPAAPGKP